MTFGYGMNPYGMGYNPAITGTGAALAALSGLGAPGQMPYASMPAGFGMAPFPTMPGIGMAPYTAPFAPAFAPPFIPPMTPSYMQSFTSPFNLGAMPFINPPTFGFGGLGGLQPSGRSVSSQFLSTGLPSDTDLEEMIYDAIDIDPLIPADTQIDVTCDSGTCTLSGDVPDKMVKHAAGQDAWWTAGVVDVRNELNVTGMGPTGAAGPKARMGERLAAQGAQQPSGQPQQQPGQMAQYHAQQAQYHAQQAQQYAQQGGQQSQ